MDRRTLVKFTGVWPAVLATGAVGNPGDLKITDSNVSLFRYPYRRLPLDETGLLLAKMKQLGIDRAVAGSFEGILHRDLSAVNSRLAKECEAYSQLIPVGSVNPVLPGWRGDLKRCGEHHKMPGIRIHPVCHGYQLDDPECKEFFERAAEMNLFVQIVTTVEDKRTQPESLHVGEVDLSPLCDHSVGRIQILNWRPVKPLLAGLAARQDICFDISRVDSTDGVATLLDTVPAERLLFGTHAPFLIPEASMIRVYESNLDSSQIHQIMHINASNFIGK